jgi:hypothetical protein
MQRITFVLVTNTDRLDSRAAVANRVIYLSKDCHLRHTYKSQEIKRGVLFITLRTSLGAAGVS